MLNFEIKKRIATLESQVRLDFIEMDKMVKNLTRKDPYINLLKQQIQNMLTLYEEQQTLVDKLNDFQRETKSWILENSVKKQPKQTQDITIQNSNRSPNVYRALS